MACAPGLIFANQIADSNTPEVMRSDNGRPATQPISNETIAPGDQATEGQPRLDPTTRHRYSSSLFERRALPQDAVAWGELGSRLASLPLRVLNSLGQAMLDIGARLGRASVAEWILLISAELLFVALVLSLRRWLARHIIQRRPDSAMVTPARALCRNLLGLIPAGALLIGAWLLAVPPVSVILLLTLLLIWPLVKFLLNLAHMVLVEKAHPENLPQRLRLYRELRWVVILTGVLAALLVIARVVALTPAVIDVLNRLSMLLLLIIALPMLHLGAAIRSNGKQVGVASPLVKLAVFLSLLAPLALIGSALVGLVGYVGLAWAIVAHLVWLALVLAGWLLARALLRDGITALRRRLHAKGDTAQFWVDNMLTPLYRLADLALLVIAGVVLFKIYGWDAETPVVRWIPALLNITLFSLGEVEIQLADLALAVLIVFVVFWIGSWSKRVSYRYAYARISDQGIRQSLSTFTQYVVVVFGLMIAFKTIGLDLTALTVFAGALGVGIGFGLQNITSNFISGILILMERPLRVNDIVNVDKYEGEVTHIGIRALTLKTWDRQEVIIPNSAVISQPFTNWTGSDDITRTVLKIGISYGDDPHQAVDIIERILANYTAILKDPEPNVLLWEFADSAVVIRVQFFTHMRSNVSRLDTRSEVLFAIWDRFKEAGISMPYPQRDIYVRSLPEKKLSTE